MPEINLNFGDTAETPTPTVNVEVSGAGFKDKSPANWNIVQQEDGSIIATSTSSLETFSGTIDEFNAKMKI